MSSILKGLLVILAAAMSACALGPTQFAALSDEQISRQDKNGVIFLRVTGWGGDPGLRANSLALTRVGKGNGAPEEIAITALDDGGLYSSSFLAAIAPGSYTVKSIGRYSSFVDIDAVLQQTIGTFTVQAGGFADLGVLVLGDNLIARSSMDAPPPRLWQGLFPNLYRKLTAGTPARWDTGKANPASSEQLAEFATPGSPDLMDIGNNELALNGPLGTIRVRDAAGKWRTISLPDASHAITYSRNDSGAEFAALEYRQFYLRDARGSGWKAVAAPDGSGEVVHAKFAKNGRLYLVMIETNGATRIYSTAPDAVQWRLDNSVAPAPAVDLAGMLPGNAANKRAPHLSVVPGQGDSIFITQIGYGTFGDNPRLIHVDLVGNDTRVLTPPFKLSYTTKIAYSNGIVTAYDRYFFASDAAPLYKSLDNGSSWEAVGFDFRKLLGDFQLELPIKFIDNNTGFAIFGNSTLMRTDDGGYQWSVIDLPPRLDRKRSSISLASGGSPDEVLIVRDGRYEVSRDLGRTWRVER